MSRLCTFIEQKDYTWDSFLYSYSPGLAAGTSVLSRKGTLLAGNRIDPPG